MTVDEKSKSKSYHAVDGYLGLEVTDGYHGVSIEDSVGDSVNIPREHAMSIGRALISFAMEAGESTAIPASNPATVAMLPADADGGWIGVRVDRVQSGYLLRDANGHWVGISDKGARTLAAVLVPTVSLQTPAATPRARVPAPNDLDIPGSGHCPGLSLSRLDDDSVAIDIVNGPGVIVAPAQARAVAGFLLPELAGLESSETLLVRAADLDAFVAATEEVDRARRRQAAAIDAAARAEAEAETSRHDLATTIQNAMSALDRVRGKGAP